MKRWIAGLLLVTLLLSLTSAALAADKVSYEGFSCAVTAKKINLGATKVTDLKKFEAFLDKLPDLKVCNMFKTTMTKDWAEKLTKRYPQVEFGWTFRIKCSNKPTHVIRTDATAFSTLHNNRSMMHTSEDFEVLKYCKRLRAVDIGHNAVTDLSFLSGLTRLRVLIIGRNKVKDLSPLKNCPELEYLEAFTNQISSVKPLLSCPHLMDLNIPNNRVQDPELFAKMTSLKRLWAFNYAWSDLHTNRVPQDIRGKVKKALPKCKINWTSSGTNGWRENTKHYDVIVEMFQTGTYIPFHDSYPET